MIYCTLTRAIVFFVIVFIIMFIVSIPNQTNGQYDTHVTFDLLDDALAFVADEIDNVYNQNSITIANNGMTIGSYSGNLQRGLKNVFTHANDFGPVL